MLSRRDKEAKTQAALKKYFDFKYPKYRNQFIKLDNEGNRTDYGHIKAVNCGLVSGASDVYIAVPTDKYAGLWMEVKPEGWRMTESNRLHTERQLEFIERQIMFGYFGKMIVGVDEGIALIDGYFNGDL